MKKIIILILGCGLVGGGYYFYKKNTPQVDQFKEVLPFYGDIEQFVATTGTVQPQNRLEIKPPINGRMDEILVQEGDLVKTGQILAWMSSTERAALLDTARSEGEKAIHYWKDVYKPTPLMSPIDGAIIVRGVEPGQTVTQSEPILVISDRLIVQATVDETDIGKVKKGQRTRIILDAYPDMKTMGTVDHIYYESKLINNVTIYLVDIVPDLVPEEYRSGMSANLEIIQNQKTHVLLISRDAVKEQDGKHTVLTRGGKKEIQTGLINETHIEITQGLNPNEIVLIRNPAYISGKKDTKTNPFMPARRPRT